MRSGGMVAVPHEERNRRVRGTVAPTCTCWLPSMSGRGICGGRAEPSRTLSDWKRVEQRGRTGGCS